MKSVIVSDLDGTLADVDHRRHFVSEKPKDYRSFYESMVMDGVRYDVLERVEEAVEKHDSELIIVSARPDNYREKTEKWLTEHGIEYSALLMRKVGDHRPDVVIKEEIYNMHLKGRDIRLVFDDRPRVIRMWESFGLQVENCGDGVEF